VNIDDYATQLHSYSVNPCRCLNKQTIHNISKSHSLQIAIENVLLDSFISLRQYRFDYWTFIEVELLSPNEFSIVVSKVPFDELLFDVWVKIIHQLIGLPNDDSRRMRYHKSSSSQSFQSTILISISTIGKECAIQKWILLYRGTIHGFRSSDCHQHRDGRANTIILILTTKGLFSVVSCQ
jgi:hypothetical protein